ncbi:VQ domain-containing protein [Cephalotus follicularis]|uniref:VQ domain-containing protein n=1 Tax=Cephalotus follicularis TaxID=3775 RepID=A0A1Q3BTF2_CEPFO|nr:VQ domain-containing protein [Cephalotus follicularis]
MDSGNSSGSVQSSSGDDQEYESRADHRALSSFLINSASHNNSNHLSSSHVGPLPNPPSPPQPPPQQQQHHSSPSMFDPLSNYFDNPISRSVPQLANPNSLLNLDMAWFKNSRSEPNCTDLGGFVATSSPTQQFLTIQAQSNRPTFGSIQFPRGPESHSSKGSFSAPGTSEQNTKTNNNNNMGVRNPKKRSRASRRAPTTVLTTDTTNFRAMVQEFTGIPAPPFTSSPFPRSRLDLFGTASSLRSTHLDPSPPSYLLRPFAQKIHPPTPFASSSSSFPSSSFVDAIASSTTTNLTPGSNNNNNNIISTVSNSTSSNYQLPQNLLDINMQNPVLNFHSLLQVPPNKYPIFGTKAQESLDISSNDSHIKVGVLGEFGLGDGHVSTNLGGLQNMVSSHESTMKRIDDNPATWAGDGLGSNEDDHQGLLRSINGNYSH